jgi:hypothetical protein
MMSPGHRVTDRAAVYLRQHENNSNKVLRPPCSNADPPPPRTDEDTIFALFSAVPTPAVQSPPPRRRVLHHPLLMPLTRLPWDRMISATGSCDLLFNCKYSAQHVEDKVRKECHHTTGGLVYVSSYPVATRADGYTNLLCGEGRRLLPSHQRQGDGGEGRGRGMQHQGICKIGIGLLFDVR